MSSTECVLCVMIKKLNETAGHVTLPWWCSLNVSMIPRAMPAGVEEERPEKGQPLALQAGVGHGQVTSSRKY